MCAAAAAEQTKLRNCDTKSHHETKSEESRWQRTAKHTKLQRYNTNSQHEAKSEEWQRIAKHTKLQRYNTKSQHEAKSEEGQRIAKHTKLQRYNTNSQHETKSEESMCQRTAKHTTGRGGEDAGTDGGQGGDGAAAEVTAGTVHSGETAQIRRGSPHARGEGQDHHECKPYPRPGFGEEYVGEHSVVLPPFRGVSQSMGGSRRRAGRSDCDHLVGIQEARDGRHSSQLCAGLHVRDLFCAQTPLGEAGRKHEAGRFPEGFTANGSRGSEGASHTGDKGGSGTSHARGKRPRSASSDRFDVVRSCKTLRRDEHRREGGNDSRGYIGDHLERNQERSLWERTDDGTDAGQGHDAATTQGETREPGATSATRILFQSSEGTEEGQQEADSTQPTAGGNTQACHKGRGVGRRVQGDATQDRGGASAVRAAGSNDTGKEDGRDLSAPMRKLLGVQRFPQQTQSTIRRVSFSEILTPSVQAYDTSNEEPDSYSAGFEAWYDNDFSVEVEGEHVRPDSRREPRGQMARISSNRMDLDAIRRMDAEGETDQVLDVITNFDRFMSLFTEKPPNKLSRGTSRHMAQYASALREWGVVEAAEGGDGVVLPAFTVAKKSGELRLVVDARRLNRIMVRPPEMRLPLIRDVVRDIVVSEAVCVADGVSYFYQIPLAHEIRKYFSLRLAGARGSTEDVQLAVLCMGWSWSPAIAQRISRVLVGRQNIAWVDNFLLLGKSSALAAEEYRKFKGRCDTAQVELHEEEGGRPQQRFEALGLEFDLTVKGFRSTEKWVAKLVESAEVKAAIEGGTSPRAFFKVVGSFVWWMYTRDRRLCFFPSMIGAVRSVAKHATTEQSWDHSVTIQQGAVREIKGCIEEICENVWVPQKGLGTATLVVWTDASSTAWAAVTDWRQGAQGAFQSTEKEHHIFLKEMWAAFMGIRLASSLGFTGGTLTLRIDNLPVVRCLEKGHSGNYLANLMMQEMFLLADRKGMAVRPLWVCTAEQVADEFTRGSQIEQIVGI